MCYDISWGVSFSRRVPVIYRHARQTKTKQERNERYFSSKSWGFNWGGSLMKRDISGVTGRADLNELKAWLTENYPGVEIPLGDLPQKFSYWSLVSGLFLQMLVTVTVGAITRFHLGDRIHATWILFWLYGSASLRWTSLITNHLDQYPCLLLKTWMLFAIGIILESFWQLEF